MKTQNIRILPVNADTDLTGLVALAENIWRDYYTSLIGRAQVDYMLKKFQNESAIFKQIQEGFDYYLIMYRDEYAGYFAIKPQMDKKWIFLSKLYVHKDFRRLGLAKIALNFIKDRSKGFQLNKIYLTVNKGNLTALEFYKKMGFVKISSLKEDIGNGFVMDDYGMLLSLEPSADENSL